MKTNFFSNELTYNSQELLETLCNQGGTYFLDYTCKYGKQRSVAFYVKKNEYGKNTIHFKRNGRKYEQEYLCYNTLTSKVLCKYDS